MNVERIYPDLLGNILGSKRKNPNAVGDVQTADAVKAHTAANDEQSHNKYQQNSMPEREQQKPAAQEQRPVVPDGIHSGALDLTV